MNKKPLPPGVHDQREAVDGRSYRAILISAGILTPNPDYDPTITRFSKDPKRKKS